LPLHNQWIRKSGVILLIAFILEGCTPDLPILTSLFFNSRYNDEDPALSGDGNYLAFTSSRSGGQQLFFYDLRQRRFLPLPGLNRVNVVLSAPSLSFSGRYIAYLTSQYGRVELEVYDRITQRQQLLTWGYRGWVKAPSISPDGRYVAVETSRHGQWDIELFDRGSSLPLDRSPLPLNQPLVPQR
jgi:Tol biopolymer transport system component